MRFVPDICDDMPPEEHRKLRTAYFQHLADHGFRASDPLYRLFACDVFHDSELLFQGIDVPRKMVTLSLRNIYAIDRICDHMRAKGKENRKLRREDFRTPITFSGVSALEIIWPECGQEPKYYAAELSREGPNVLLEIMLEAGFKQGMLRISFRSAEVTDIGAQIRKCLGAEVDPVEFLTFIRHGPAYYAAHPEAFAL